MQQRFFDQFHDWSSLSDAMPNSRGACPRCGKSVAVKLATGTKPEWNFCHKTGHLGRVNRKAFPTVMPHEFGLCPKLLIRVVR
jgi:hypothetical protein